MPIFLWLSREKRKREKERILSFCKPRIDQFTGVNAEMSFYLYKSVKISIAGIDFRKHNTDELGWAELYVIGSEC